MIRLSDSGNQFQQGHRNKTLGTTDSFPFSTITMLSKSAVAAAIIVQAICIAVTESSSDVIFTGYIEGTSNNKVNCGSVSGFRLYKQHHSRFPIIVCPVSSNICLDHHS
jgi:hypothetical protein